MVTRKPLAPRILGSEAGLPYPMSPSSADLEESTTQATTSQKPLYTLHDESIQPSNPWQDAERPADSKKHWENPKGTSRPGTMANTTGSGHIPIAPETLSDHLNQDGIGFPELTPQSSWERDSESSEEDVPTKPVLKAPTHRPPPPPIQTSTSRPVDTNPYRAKSSERVPQVPISKEEDSTNIWAEIAQDKKVSIPEPVPAVELERLAIEDKRGWSSMEQAPSGSIMPMDSPLIDLDQANDYRRELEATPFGPPEGLENLATNKGKGQALLNITTNDEGFAPPFGLSPTAHASKFVDRKITVPEEIANKQRGETYQIKHIRWADSNSHEIKVSPILIQNKNGPCPLMALVNALTLSTPPELDTALIETLRVREQISLGLLLDAVFDELMSGRRGDAAQGLPDVSELYAFLITLHTGMNVNPRFIPAKRHQRNLIDGSYEEVSLSPEDYQKPGSFEYTKEMMLYGTFSIPLIHGWVPPTSHPAFRALERSATTYEDAQNLMFREEELEDKIQSSGLSGQEQQLLEDISSVRFFLDTTATQLTEHGLESINESLLPGAIAIFFRNDHFNTLYKQPRTGQLLLLVTDAGYSAHDEVVWESLVDIGGEGSEFFSGDFRLVGGHPSQSQAFDQADAHGSDWTTVQRGKGRNATISGVQAANKALSNVFEALPPSPTGRNHEQEDADLALAMQLQEEEEQNSRLTSAQRRQQEEEASSQFLAQNASNQEPAPTSPTENRRRARRSSGIQQQPQPLSNVQPLLPPRRSTAQINTRTAVHRAENSNDDDAPPSYEQAAKAEPYVGPAPSQTSVGSGASQEPRPNLSGQPSSHNIRPRGQSVYSANTVQGVHPVVTSPSSRRRSVQTGVQEPPIGVTRRVNSASSEDNRDCVLM
ncbi:MAG: hypothetical protein GOMPHAMPRED_006885 [Gomphillus americanus]|uniref:MINDY deubiquitinase domain-containing protein n=1 Tax=Gomphillus americanus TaxID=1940652 RepID=A0A8H3ENF6_9LECA|nr:MAG: hypothetical protein GOMPHAMPRED_006885 [Gomphillus americanus]